MGSSLHQSLVLPPSFKFCKSKLMKSCPSDAYVPPETVTGPFWTVSTTKLSPNWFFLVNTCQLCGLRAWSTTHKKYSILKFNIKALRIQSGPKKEKSYRLMNS